MAMLSVEEAQARLMALFAPVGTEIVPLEAAAGRVLAADAVAARAQPPFPASAMDGYAVRAADLAGGGSLRVVGTAQAGRRHPGAVGPGEAVRIFTGAPVPEGADAILIQEDAEREGDIIRARADRDAGPYVRPAGGDFPGGARLEAPRRLGPSEVALLAAMGLGAVTVARRPVVALVPTGDELVWPGEAPGPDQIVSSNNFGLKALLEAEGAEARLLPIARDSVESLEAVFALAAGADLIVTLGGASVGDHDLVRQAALGRGLALDFYKVAMRPGKPLMAGRLGAVPLVGLPGNPVSAMVCGHVFLRPAVRAMLGLGWAPPQPLPGVLAAPLEANGPRAHYMRGRALQGPEGWRVTAFERQDSSLLTVLAEANALVVRPPRDPARTVGESVTFLPL
jgi:molybdopterin molybdotransferase